MLALVLAFLAGNANAQQGILILAGPGITPPTCNGTIDLSTGCAQGMLGGL